TFRIQRRVLAPTGHIAAFVLEAVPHCRSSTYPQQSPNRNSTGAAPFRELRQGAGRVDSGGAAVARRFVALHAAERATRNESSRLKRCALALLVATPAVTLAALCPIPSSTADLDAFSSWTMSAMYVPCSVISSRTWAARQTACRIRFRAWSGWSAAATICS